MADDERDELVRAGEALDVAKDVQRRTSIIAKAGLPLLAKLIGDAAIPGVGDGLALGVAGAQAAYYQIRGGGDVEAFQHLEDRAPEIAEKRAALAEAVPGAGSAADVAAIVDAYLAAVRQQTDRRVRELIENATVNGFDPKQYEGTPPANRSLA